MNRQFDLTEEEYTLPQILDMCAEDIARNLQEGRPDEPVGDTWTYGTWTVEWEGDADFWSFSDRSTNSSDSTLTSLELSRAEAWQGDNVDAAQDVREDLQQLVNSYVEKNRQDVRKYWNY